MQELRNANISLQAAAKSNSLLALAAQDHAGLPVVIMSGSFSKIAPEELAGLGEIELLAKPFTSEELAHAVHRALHPAERTP